MKWGTDTDTRTQALMTVPAPCALRTVYIIPYHSRQIFINRQPINPKMQATFFLILATLLAGLANAQTQPCYNQ